MGKYAFSHVDGWMKVVSNPKHFDVEMRLELVHVLLRSLVGTIIIVLCLAMYFLVLLM